MKIFLLLIAVVVAVASQQAPICPSSQYSTLVHAHLSISLSSSIAFVPGTDTKCYNYSINQPFQNKPGIAFAVKHLEASQTNDLFFSIRSVRSDNLAVLSFLIRTQWKYTNWSKITFTFIAQDYDGIEAGFFNIDTGNLAGCNSGKDLRVLLPFRKRNLKPTQFVTYIHGFELSSLSYGGGQSPFQLQIVSPSINSTGITLSLTTTSITQVFSIFISFVAYESSFVNGVSGIYTYSNYQPISSLSFTPQQGLAPGLLQLHGLNGFIITNTNMGFLFDAAVASGAFTFTTSTTFQFLTYSYFLVVGGQCALCQNYNLFSSGTCVSSCPQGSYPVAGQCITCSQNQYWNGSACVANQNQCQPGTYWNGTQCVPNQNQCQLGYYWNGTQCIPNQNCPPGYYWNGNQCISNQIVCPPGTVWNGSQCVYQNQNNCPLGSVWNGYSCVPFPNPNPHPEKQCPNGQIWNCQLKMCVCPDGMTLTNGVCTVICSGGQVWCTKNQRCVCPNNENWNGVSCISCTNGQSWNSTTLSCVCPNNQYYNGYSCISCPTGQSWNALSSTCTCPFGQNWNGFSCITCSNGQIFNSTTLACACPSGLNWNGKSCIACQSGSYWNGYSCVTCSGGQVWNSFTVVCECPTGMQWNGYACIQPCPNGQNYVNGVCSCPNNQVLVNGVCVPQQSCQPGYQWNGTACVPILCPPGQFWNGSCCISQNANCPAGTYFDGYKCICSNSTCPPGTVWNGNYCMTNSSQCPAGYFWSGQSCQQISQQCPAYTVWQNNRCVPSNNQCPAGSYLSGQICIPIQPCPAGKIWSSTLSQCVCADNSFWNGNMCIKCANGQTYSGYIGCTCPVGSYFDGNSCIIPSNNNCANVSNSYWNGSICLCNAGFISIGMNCVCQGLIIDNTCNQCYAKPNSIWKYGYCQCSQGYYESQGQCLPYNPSPNPVLASCSVSTFFDNQQKACLPCSDGCLSCSSCYSCTQCRPEFNFDFISSLCTEVCGDGKRFNLACDDGNNANGDGCSSDCHLQPGYNCVGGSPNSPDICSLGKPSAISIINTGQSHIYGSVILNIKINYLPQQLIKSKEDCASNCGNVLDVKIISGFASSTAIISKFIPTSSYSFSVQVQFGKEPIGLFRVRISIACGIALKYFAGIDVSQKLQIDVNPAYLSLATTGKDAKNSTASDTLS